MKSFSTDFEGKVCVQFKDPKAAQAFYMGEEWASCFTTHETMEELAEDIANTFFHERVQWNRNKKLKTGYQFKFLEGFGEFKRDLNSIYTLQPKYQDGGEILVYWEDEIEPTYTH